MLQDGENTRHAQDAQRSGMVEGSARWLRLRIADPIMSRGLNQTDCLALEGVGTKCLLRFDEAAHYNEAVTVELTLYRSRSHAVGHCDARTSRRGGAVAIAALFHDPVPPFAARKGIGRMY